MEKQQQFFGSIAAQNVSNQNYDSDTDKIAGEASSSTENETSSSTNINVVGLAVFKDDVLVR